MNGAVEAEAKPVLDALKRAGLANTATVVLVGSGARGVRNPRSDIDILVLHDDGHRIRLKRPGDIHLQQVSRSKFLRRLEKGDDYPCWDSGCLCTIPMVGGLSRWLPSSVVPIGRTGA